jgi:hypothetical protein
VAWGNYDNDGRLDILLTGYTGMLTGYTGIWTGIATVYHNNGDGTFADISAGLTGVGESSVAWGDYDNDGRLDILLTGSPDGSYPYIAKVYHNNTPVAPTGVILSGPTTGTINTAYTFAATVNPITATTPITYTWTPPPDSGQDTANATYSWATTGDKTITVTTQNPVNTVADTHGIVISIPPDVYEPDDTCAQAQAVLTDGTVQEHTFHQQADRDWVTFTATAGITYFIQAQVPPGSPADVTLELYNRCGDLPQSSQGYTFTPEVRLQFQSQTDGPIYLQFLNDSPAVYGPQVAYQLSVRALGVTPTPGAVVIVAGRFEIGDHLQSNINNVTDSVYRLFVKHGYTASRIDYLANDPTLPGFDAMATANNLRAAITSWALDKVGPDRPFTLYLVDHGDYDRIYLDASGQWITPEQLNEWLTQLEAARPGVEINVMVEACHSGSFIDPLQSVSRPGRVVIASTGASNPAWVSDNGAIFSDQFVSALDRGESLHSSFQSALWAVQAARPFQTPWLDDNGDGKANDPTDGQEAARRGFDYPGTLMKTYTTYTEEEQWPPYIVWAEAGPVVNGRAVITAEIRDDKSVRSTRVMIYPPSYQPPAAGERIISETLPTINLLAQGADSYAATYTGFDEIGAYRVVVYAGDNTGVEARPVAIEVRTGWKVFVPLVRKSN